MPDPTSSPLIDLIAESLPDAADAYGGRRVLVTGGAGFIGSHLVDALVDLGASVVVIDDLSNGAEANLNAVRDRIDFHHASILDRDALRAACDGVHTIFHQAALGSVPRSVEEPVLYQQVNASGTLNVLEEARLAGAEHIVYAASSSAYGDQAQSPKVETMRPDPLSPYAATKFAGEHLVRAYAHCYGLRCVSLRYFNIFGARQQPDSQYAAVIPRFIDAMRRGDAPVIYGDGTQTRDFTHVSNAVLANLLAAACDRELRGEVVNIACGAETSVLELAQKIAMLLKVDAEFRFAPQRIGEVQHSVADISLAGELIGYRPRTTLTDGLRRTAEWFARLGA